VQFGHDLSRHARTRKRVKAEQRDAARAAAAEKAAKEAAEKKAQRAEEKKAAEEKAEQEKKARAEKRIADRQERERELEQRRAETITEGARRVKATHIVLRTDGLSQPQQYSVRGRVLKWINENCEVGVPYPIEKIGEELKPILFGSSIRSYLSKLEEMRHVDFKTIEQEATQAGEPSTQENANAA
jgi:flagellar biosynthesis GTPase FlhF